MMTRYRMDDGKIVDTANATDTWGEERDFDGKNQISRNTGSQWEHETLYSSAKGRYYIVSTSDWQGSQSTARWVEDREAVGWLLLNEHEMPAELDLLAKLVSE